MAKYWIYVNDQVAGPYSVEQLIRLRGFSRQSQVCVDDESGVQRLWTSPAEIPELAPIFKAVEQMHESRTSPAPLKAAAKPITPRPPGRPTSNTPVAPSIPARTSSIGLKIFSSLMILFLLGGAATWWLQKQARLTDVQQRQAVRNLVEMVPLPASSLYSTLRHFFTEKRFDPQWQFDRLPTGLYNVTGTWSGGDPTGIYVFEANLEAQTVRGVNSAAARLLSEGFPRPVLKKPEPSASAKPSDSFLPAVQGRCSAVEKGDFSEVWQLFSPRKRSEMNAGGISESGYVRLQALTHGLEAGIKQSVLKTHKEEDNAMLVLLRQEQPGHADMFLKQRWVYAANQWKLDEEEKKMANSPETATPANESRSAPADAPAIPAAIAPASSNNPSTNSAMGAPPTSPKISPLSLPGVSN